MKTKTDILMAMYRSVDRMNEHFRNGNDHGISSERWLQRNLRNNIKTLNNDEN